MHIYDIMCFWVPSNILVPRAFRNLRIALCALASSCIHNCMCKVVLSG